MASGFVLPSVAGLCRTPGADERLRELLRLRQFQPFQWGVQDCCLFAADAVQVQIGVDPAEPLRGRYATELQAARLLHAAGGVEGIARQVLGDPLPAPLLACQGDVVMVADAGRDVLAVCVGDCLRLPSAHGLALMPLRSARMAWRVGCG